MAKAMRQQRYGKSNLFILPGFLLFLAGPNGSMWNYDYTVINSAVVSQDLRDTPYIIPKLEKILKGCSTVKC